MLRLSREVIVSRIRKPRVLAMLLGALVGAAIIASLFVARAPQPAVVVRVTAPPAPPEPVRLEPVILECPTAPAPPATVEEIEFDPTQLDPAMKHRGKLVRGVRWSDALGDNVALFSQLRTRRKVDGLQLESSYLFLYHYVRGSDGKVRLVRVVRERDEDCSDDLVSSFHRAYEITDLDRDGAGELLFAYFHGACITDMSPAGFKLLMLEFGDKYVLRGRDHLGGYDQPAEPTSTTLAGAPPAFEHRLRNRWLWLSNRMTSGKPL